MQYPVPQFIERESRIVGPLSFKQAIFLGVAGGLSLVVWLLLPTAVAMVLICLIAAAAVALSFWKPHGRPLAEVIVSAFRHFISARQYLWQRQSAEDLPIITSGTEKTGPVKADPADHQALMELSPRSRLEKLKNRIETK